MPHQVKLVVIDSVAFHFRQDFRDMALRTRLLNGMAQQLLRLAAENELAVVLVNQMTTRLGRGSEEAHLIPALGKDGGISEWFFFVQVLRTCSLLG
jgi:RAD51-like protein 2